MFFNSLEFAFFLPIAFAIYWLLNKQRVQQNIWLIFISYIFYGWWDWRFLSLIIFSSFVDFFAGQKIEKSTSQKHRKRWLFLSLFTNLGLLGFFKYYNFFIDSFSNAFSFFGHEIQGNSLNIILPVGISFYTFQTLSYTVDVYRKKLKASNDITAFFAYVSFFPQLVAGPIERATNLLPQFLNNRKFNSVKATDGMRQMLWGLFKKIVIADNCAVLVNDIFATYDTQTPGVLMLGAIYFAIQIYCDFSGYSDIAIGVARLFGFDLMRNFALPYFSRDIAEFWRRWHISLSTWFRDYLYIPLGGSRGSKSKQFRNVMIIFLVSGFWHGANWTFVIWGGLNALFFLPLMLSGKNRANLDIAGQNSYLPSLKEVWQILTTFLLTCFAWIFFRAESLEHAIGYLQQMLDWSDLSIPFHYLEYLPFIFVLMIIEWIQRKKLHPLEINFLPSFVRQFIYIAVIIQIIIFMNPSNDMDFIYFQF